MNGNPVLRVILIIQLLGPLSAVFGLAQAQEPVGTVWLDGPLEAIEIMDDYPAVRARLSVVDQRGFAISGLEASDFAVVERGNRIPPGRLATQEENTGLVLAIVMDTGPSMGDRGTPDNSRFQDAQNLAQRFIQSLDPEDWIAVYTYSDGVSNPLPLTYDHGRALTVVRREIEIAQPEGDQTAERRLFQATRQAILDLVAPEPDIPNFAHMRKAVLVISDSSNEGALDQEDVRNALDQDTDRLISIYSVGVGSEAEGEYIRFPADHSDVEYLSTIADGGFVNYFGMDASQRADAEAQLQATIGPFLTRGRQYLLNWTSTSPDGPTPVEISVGGQRVRGEVVIPVAPPVFRGYSIVSEPGSVKIRAEFKVQQRPIVTVDLFEGGQLLGTTGPPFEFVWDTSQVTPGTYQLEMLARDERGIESEPVRLQDTTVIPAPTPSLTPSPPPTATPTAVPTSSPTPAPVAATWLQDPANVTLLVLSSILLLLILLVIWVLVWFLRRVQELSAGKAPGRPRRMLEATVSLLTGESGARLEVMAGKDQGDIVPLNSAGGSWRFGRDPEYNDRVLSDPTVSRITNFTIAHEGRKYYLVAHAHTTPVFHNGTQCQVEKRVELREGDRISVGLVEILFLMDRTRSQAPPPPGPGGPPPPGDEGTTRVSPDDALRASRH